MHRPSPNRRLRGLAAMLAIGAVTGLTTSTTALAGKAHEHGALKLDVVLDGANLSVALEAPLDNLLGFERAPRTAAERQAAADLLARLRSPAQAAALLVPEAAARCTLAKAEVQAPVLEPGSRPPAQDDHADLDARYEFSCAQPAALRQLDTGLFQAFARVQRIDVQVAGPAGQFKATLKRPARTVRLVR